MGKYEIIITVLAVIVLALAVAIIAVTFAYVKLKKKYRDGGDYPDDVKVRGGVRYSTDDAAFRDGARFHTCARHRISCGERRRAHAGRIYRIEVI